MYLNQGQVLMLVLLVAILGGLWWNMTFETFEGMKNKRRKAIGQAKKIGKQLLGKDGRGGRKDGRKGGRKDDKPVNSAEIVGPDQEQQKKVRFADEEDGKMCERACGHCPRCRRCLQRRKDRAPPEFGESQFADLERRIESEMVQKYGLEAVEAGAMNGTSSAAGHMGDDAPQPMGPESFSSF